MPKPLLFPENYDPKKFNPRDRNSGDPSRIGGYSEAVQANDIALADDLEFAEKHRTGKVIKRKEDAYKVIGAKPQALPVEFRWLRITGPGGAYSASASAEIDSYTADQGFIPCTEERFKALSETYGYEFNHNLWRVAEDGTIRRGYDTALFYRPGEVARAWEAARVAETAAREGRTLPETFRSSKFEQETFLEEEHEEVIFTH